jgi:hypothetical protein
MPDEIDKQIDEFLNGFKEYGIDFFGDMKKHGIDEKEARIHLRLMFDEELHKKVFGVTRLEQYLMEEGLNLEEARYVIKHPCLEDAENNCSYHKENGKMCSVWMHSFKWVVILQNQS